MAPVTRANGKEPANKDVTATVEDVWAQKRCEKMNKQLIEAQAKYAQFHGDPLIGDTLRTWTTTLHDLSKVFTFKNLPEIFTVAKGMIAGKGLDIHAGAQLVGSLPNNSKLRAGFTESQVQAKYDKMLHPPLTYLGDAFQYRTADGKYNSVMNPHLGQGNSPYAKTVPSKSHALGALPDPGDLFERLMAREPKGRESTSGLSAMLIYHATIIIHDIFRTNTTDKNISDSSSYLDLSPLYGYTDAMQKEVRDSKYKLGLLKPDTFAEDRLLRQPAGVCIMLVMYNRYHNYAATQLRRINENERFAVPSKFDGPLLAAQAKFFVDEKTKQNQEFKDLVSHYSEAHDHYLATGGTSERYEKLKDRLEHYLRHAEDATDDAKAVFEKAHTAAWDKLDEDLFQTARLITCGIYIQISIHDYLRALMGFHQYNTDFTLDPRIAMTENRNVSRGLGNQVTVEFNLLYRFHCAISLKDEEYAEDYMREYFDKPDSWDPKKMELPEFLNNMKEAGIRDYKKNPNPTPPWKQTFGLTSQPELNFQRNPITGLFDDQKMINEMLRAMDDPISNFGPRNTPRCLKAVEVMGIMQARKWEIGSLNDFREFFGMKRHETFESITGDEDVQDALRDLYDHPDKVELYPGIFCESDEHKNADPGPSGLDSALWSAIFSDAITLVRSDRFYTVDWNTKSLTSWGMKEVTADSEILKTSVFHRLIQRAFPEWFPYDSIRFFHPFYTGQTNARFAQQQGYGGDFSMKPPSPLPRTLNEDTHFDIKSSEPKKPKKPIVLSKHDEIMALLSDKTDNFVHPARFQLEWIPKPVREILAAGHAKGDKQKSTDSEFNAETPAIIKYFIDLSHDILQREAILMNKQLQKYQLDVTRDFAIPITTRYVADFLGFGHLVRSDHNSSAPYSENEIYQHITNCQIFLAYNVDETKLLKRRAAFRTSMTFLYDLTKQGNVYEASRWPLTKWLRKTFGVRTPNPMTTLGFKVADQIIKHYPNHSQASAIMLLVGLDAAYNSVLAFTSVLRDFLRKLYDTPTDTAWLKVQKLALHDDSASFSELEKLVLDAQRKTVKLPVIRKAFQSGTIRGKHIEPIHVDAHQIIVADINKVHFPDPATSDEHDYLTYASSFTTRFSHYHPKHIAALSLTSMIKVLAQTKNLRPGHDTQGHLKKIELDSSAEGYSNFMAPLRMVEIADKVHKSIHNVDPEHRSQAEKKFSKIFTKAILKPKSDTFLTPEWDEFVPFPTTWKVRFDGYGVSDYTSGPGQIPYYNQPQFDTRQFDFPPFYQPQGISTTGGNFAVVTCVCNSNPKIQCACKDAAVKKAEEDKKKAEEAAKDAGKTAPPPFQRTSTRIEAANAVKAGHPVHLHVLNGCGMGTPKFTPY